MLLLIRGGKMKNLFKIEESKKDKVIWVLSFIMVVLLGVVVFLYGKRHGTEIDENIDAKKFSEEYNISVDNVFQYKTSEEILKIMKNGTGVVYLGFPECPWCVSYVGYLNDVAKENGLEKIYYYNILEDRKNNTEFYQEVVKLLSGNLQYDEEGNERIYVPNVSFHVNGKVIGNDYETSKDTKGFDTPCDYWTNEEEIELKNTLTTYTKEVVNSLSVCTDCNK